MKIEYDCIPCIYRQVLEASRMAVGENRKIIRDILNEYARMIPDITDDDSAPEIVTRIQNYIKQKTGKDDIYLEFKEKNIKAAQQYYPTIEKLVKSSEDPLLSALIMSAVGNSIDAGVSLNVDIEDNVKRAIENGFSHSDYPFFKEQLSNANSILIIADNAGEAVFDKLLIQELLKYKVTLTYAVRDKPILNDVTRKEAKNIGIDRYCSLISSGCDTPGIVLKNSSKEFLQIFSNADIIISKGQGNLEGLLDESRPIFYLLKIKCDVIAKRLNGGLKTGNFVFKYY
ncbi:hypothetical protein X928_04665 [Petrotoga miotherma DSM 10691]|uniref:Damage-control phosphatase ARMT1-like metal-binding domain-containing protein n=1 Tax=Petrotoga miotherma DSM 10691 TaxID=1434326 RepID=A0A2K1PCS9_9BACT|nr:ARMT1-like domain-containing protein [Petrotoga miotherma]PNS00579.1 hypothetical protein X928_04665 [Petrotoga miotherma DSM 10691]